MRHDKKLTTLAQQLRKDMTKEERRLWYDYLSKYPLRFRRQVACGHFIMDFYCAQAKLAVELDGSQHFMPDGMRQDAQRTEYLNEMGIEVLRFSNTDVLQNLHGVCECVDNKVKERVEHLSRLR